jgi:hypothetical protein
MQTLFAHAPSNEGGRKPKSFFAFKISFKAFLYFKGDYVWKIIFFAF